MGMRRVAVWCGVVGGAIALAGCGEATSSADASPAAVGASSPREALESMLALAREGRWAEYIDGFYGERHKLGGPEDRARLIEMVSGRAENICAGLEAALGVEPEISEDGKRAVFRVSEHASVSLYRGGDGWKFSL